MAEEEKNNVEAENLDMEALKAQAIAGSENMLGKVLKGRKKNFIDISTPKENVDIPDVSGMKGPLAINKRYNSAYLNDIFRAATGKLLLATSESTELGPQIAGTKLKQGATTKFGDEIPFSIEVKSEEINTDVIDPEHPEHKQWLRYTLGLSAYYKLQGDEKFERVEIKYKPDVGGDDMQLDDFKEYLKSLNLPVYETLPTPDSFGYGTKNKNYLYTAGLGEKYQQLNNLEKFKKHSLETNNIWQLDDAIFNGDLEETTSNIHEHVSYEDHVFSYSSPTPFRKIEKDHSNLKSSFYEVESNYNYSIPLYEQAVSNPIVKEPLLPNIYNFLTYQKNKNDQFTKTHFTHLLLNGYLTGEVATDILNGFFLKENAVLSPVAYFRALSEYILAASSDASNFPGYDLSTQYQNIGFSQGELLSILQDAKDKKFNFPMSIGLRFSTDTKSAISQIMKKAKFTRNIISNLSSPTTNNVMELMYYPEEISQLVFDPSNPDLDYAPESMLMPQGSAPYKVWHLDDIYKVHPDDSLVIMGYDDAAKPSGMQYNFYNMMLNKIFQQKVSGEIRKHTRNYRQIFDNKEAYNETLAYRIEKIRVAENVILPQEGVEDSVLPEGSELTTQNFYIPNSNELDILEFVDTQVKFNTKYNYKVFAYQVVYGTEYKYCRCSVGTDHSVENGHGYRAEFIVMSRPSPIIVEVPYFGDLPSDLVNKNIVDTPPMPPDFDIVPYKGMDNKLLINLKHNTGRMDAIPTPIEIVDKDLFLKAAESQGKNNIEVPITFASEEEPLYYEVYRTTKFPGSYEDFRDKKIADLSVPLSQTSFIDEDIKPNKKYYYTFRSCDNHEWKSNPTPIIRVELVNNDGAVYLLQNMIEFPTGLENIVNKKHFKRYIYIKPEFGHITPSYPEMEVDLDESAFDAFADEVPVLGVKNKPLMGKTFKIRFKSKNTSKVFDLNVKFEHAHISPDPIKVEQYNNNLTLDEESEGSY